jgi:hypothetical protein
MNTVADPATAIISKPRACPGADVKLLPPLPVNLPMYPPQDPGLWILGPNGMVSAWMDINAERALDILVNNYNNRHMHEPMVTRCSRALNASNWHEHHQGIAFNTLGELADGQHRLEAIARTGKSCYMLVTWNLPSKAQAYIDDHLVRTHADAAKVMMQTSGSVVATGKRMAAGLGRTCQLSKHELNIWLKAFDKGLRFAEHCFPSKHKNGITVVGTKAVFARAYYAHPQQEARIREFARILYDGRTAQPTVCASAPLTLRKKLTGRGRFTPNSETVYSLTERALRCFLDEEECLHLSGTSCELFRLPAALLDDVSLPSEEEIAARRLANHPLPDEPVGSDEEL